MKSRILTLLAVLLLCGISASAQSAVTLSVTVDAPASCAIAFLPNPVSASGSHLLAGKPGLLNFDISKCTSLSATATATWDGVATSLTFAAGPPATLTAAISAAQATLGAHSLVITVPQPLLALTLPNARPGVLYSTDLSAATGIVGTYSLTSGALPSGLSLSSSGLVTGTSLAVGTFNFGWSVTSTAALLKTVKFTFA